MPIGEGGVHDGERVLPPCYSAFLPADKERNLIHFSRSLTHALHCSLGRSNSDVPCRVVVGEREGMKANLTSGIVMGILISIFSWLRIKSSNYFSPSFSAGTQAPPWHDTTIVI